MAPQEETLCITIKNRSFIKLFLMQWKYQLLAATIMLTMWCTKGNAQNGNDPFFLNYNFFPGADFKERDGSSAMQSFEAGILMPPVRLGKRTMLVNGFNYKFTSYDFDELHTAYGGLPDHLHDIRYSLAINHQLSKQWGILAVPRVNLRSDLEDGISGHGIFPGITALALRTSARHPGLRYGFGVMYNNDLNRNSIIPAAALFYTTDKMRISIVTPNGQLIFTPSKRFEYGLSVNVDAGIFHTSLGGVSHGPVRYIRTFNLLLSPVASFNICRNLWFNAKAGYALMRRYDLLDEDFEDEQAWRQDDLKNGPYVTVGISMRLNNRAAKTK